MVQPARLPPRRVQAVLFPEDADLEGKPAGSFKWMSRVDGTPNSGLLYVCPCGCGKLHAITTVKGTGSRYWDWDGDVEKPTCKPSIGMYPKDGGARDGSKYHWHGFLTAGVFAEC